MALPLANSHQVNKNDIHSACTHKPRRFLPKFLWNSIRINLIETVFRHKNDNKDHSIGIYTTSLSGKTFKCKNSYSSHLLHGLHIAINLRHQKATRCII